MMSRAQANLSARALWANATLRAAVWGGALIAAWYVLVPLVTGYNYLGLDLARTDLGSLCELKGWLADHRAPGISRYLGAGQPLFAEPQLELLYPPRWIMMLLSTRAAILFQTAFHLGLGAFAVGLLLRRQRVSARTVFGGALAYGLSGTAANYVYHSVFILDLAWVPLFWVAISQSMRPRISGGMAARAALGAGLCLLMLMLGGEPHGVIWCAGIAIVEAIIYLRRKIRNSPNFLVAVRRTWPCLAWIGLILVAALSISMILWLPTMEELRVSIREGQIDAFSAMGMSYAHGEWLATFLPGILDNTIFPVTPLYKFFYLELINPNIWNISPYLGFLLVGLAAGASVRRRNRKFAVVGAIAVLLALGYLTPIYPWLFKHVSLISKLRYPAKQLVLVNLCVVMLGACGLDRILRQRDRRLYLISLGMTAFFGVFALGWLMEQGPRFEDTILKVLPGMRATDSGEFVSPLEFIRGCLIRGLAPALIAWISLFSVRLSRLTLPLVLLIDLGMLNYVALPLSPEPYHSYEETAMKGLRAHENPETLGPLDQELLCTFPMFDMSGPVNADTGTLLLGTTYRFQKIVGTSEVNACNQERTWPPYSVFTPRITYGLRDAQQFDQRISWARAAGCTIWITHYPLPKNRSEGLPYQTLSYELEGSNRDYTAYRITDPLPYVGIIRDPFWELTREHFFRYMELHEKSAEIYRSVSPSPRATGLSKLPDGKAATLKRGTHPRPDYFEAELGGKGGAVLEFRHPFALGWQATQNGKPLETIRVLAQFLGVIVPDVTAGPIQVEYFIPRLAAGAIGSLVGFLALLIGYLGLRRETST